jgi:putative toxin-antitoxin system antitoxin component (TIGR02293 family)
MKPVDVLGGVEIVGEFSTATDIQKRLREGMPAEVLRPVRERLQIGEAELAAALTFSPGTYGPSTLPPHVSGHLYRWAVLFSKAVETLGSEAKAAEWIKRPNAALDGATPLEVIDTDFGIDEVEGLLEKINHGIAA